MILDEKYTGRDGLTTRERFWKFVKKTNECWEWLGSRKRNRYGKFKFNNKNYSAHKFSYFLSTGYMPSKNEYVCHSCDNTYCVNPSHLFLGTQQDNMDDMVSKERSPDNHGGKNPRAKLLDDEVFEIRRLYSLGLGTSILSKIFRKPMSTISNIINKNTWKNLLGGTE